MQNSVQTQGVLTRMRKVHPLMRRMAAQTRARAKGHAPEALSNGIKPMGVQIKLAKMHLHKKTAQNRTTCNRLTTFKVEMFCLGATVPTEADREAMVATLETATDVVSVRTILLAVLTQVQAQILATETRIGVTIAVRALTETAVRHSQTQ